MRLEDRTVFLSDERVGNGADEFVEWPVPTVPRGKAAVKRTFDVLMALVICPLLTPLWIVLWLLIRLDSPGPALFRQTRTGRGGKPFTLYKLRSMIHNAEEATGPVWAASPDPRETRVGHFLRRYGLDETMQIINILRGEMSFVGPRPERPFFVHKLKQEIPGYMDRTLVRPGLTGWAQVNMKHRYDLSVHDVRAKLFYDLEYINRQSFSFDIAILFKTTTVLFRG